MSSSAIIIDDLASPNLCDEAKAILEKRAAKPYEYSLKGVMEQVAERIDVPVFEDAQGSGLKFGERSTLVP
ncbi:hypothetical protein [Paraglaciecola sp. 20A4]|uniref:hypothetical protein n=1 Tax=Paraglaciecola sp. 20A4 TaxID=2687288 RepID=UPI00140BD99A|nr:hypothetical protein [Paraglaciecola sp. 20A4]